MTMPSTASPSPSLLLAGLLGITGVALAAAASHLGDGHLLGNAAQMCLVHAPALVAIHAAGERLRTGNAASLLLGLGTVLFAGDLVYRHSSGNGLFPMAAPTGGIVMMAGWLAVGVGALFRPRMP